MKPKIKQQDNNVLRDWSPSEKVALQQALQRIKYKSLNNKIVETTLPHCYYSLKHKRYVVRYAHNEKMIHVGTMRIWDENLAIEMIKLRKLKQR